MENIKHLSFDEKVLLLKDYFNGKTVSNELGVNVYSLIAPNKFFSDDYFSNDNIIFSDIMEFLDIKMALADDLNKFISKLLGIYLSCYKHCSVIDSEENVKIDQQYLILLCMLDITTMSKLMDKHTPDEDNNYYAEAFGIVKHYSEQFSLYSSMVEQNMEIFKDGN